MRVATFILSLALITAAAFLSVKGFYRVVKERLRVEEIQVAAGETPDRPGAQTAHTGKDYTLIAKRNLFDVKKKQPAKEKKKSAPPKVTRLQLKLWGTISGSESQRAAIVEDGKTRKQLLLHEGDKIQTAVIKHISRGEVLLAVNGKNEVLLIEKPAGARRGAKGGGDDPGLPPPPVLTPEAGAEIEPVEGALVTIDHETVQTALQNVNELMRQARVRPHFTNGKPDGLRLSAIRPGSLFRQIGLRTGDIITGVNGDPIESVDDALRFYTSLKDADDVTLQLRRGGVERSINYRVE